MCGELWECEFVWVGGNVFISGQKKCFQRFSEGIFGVLMPFLSSEEMKNVVTINLVVTLMTRITIG